MNRIEKILQDLLQEIRYSHVGSERGHDRMHWQFEHISIWPGEASFIKSPGAHVYTVTGLCPLKYDSPLCPENWWAWKNAQETMAEDFNAKFVVDVNDNDPDDLKFVVTVERLPFDECSAARDSAESALETLKPLYGNGEHSTATMLTDFFTDIMHLLGHAEATRLFDRAGDHWEEERAK